MPRQADHEKIRNALLDAVVKAGADYGLAGITNQAIKELSGQSEPYVYRYFIDRNDMIAKAFFRSDENFFSMVEEKSGILIDPSIEKGRHRFEFFKALIDYGLKNTDYTKFYIRYYYSAMFDEEQREHHRQICEKHFTPFKHIFEDGIDCYYPLHQGFGMLLANVMDFATDGRTNSPENREKVAQTLVMMINPYLKEHEKI